MKYIDCPKCGQELIFLEPCEDGIYQYWCDKCDLDITIVDNKESNSNTKNKNTWIRNLLFKRKYTIKFLKHCKDYNVADGSYREVSDAKLYKVLLELQFKYNFDIISMKYGDISRFTKLTIKCNRKDINNIVGEYIMMLSQDIDDVSFK